MRHHQQAMRATTGTHSFALARLGRHWEVFLKPRVPERGLVGGGFGRLIAVKVDIQPNHDRAAAVDGSKGGYGWPPLVQPYQDVVPTLVDVLYHSAQRRGTHAPPVALPNSHAF